MSMMQSVIFLLSPASCTGKRAGYLMRDRAAFPLAQEIRSPEGARLGDVFTFMSGLYFRGKLAYGRRFASAPAGVAGVQVITPDRGLVSAEARIGLHDLRAFARVAIDIANPAYRVPLEAGAAQLARQARGARVVLLGSIATDKYVGILDHALGGRLLFPQAFVGRGDMSRGGLMLRCAESGEELEYVPVAGAARRGSRPPRLTPKRR